MKATVNDIKFEEVKIKLNKIFSEQQIFQTSTDQIRIKPETTLHTSYDRENDDFEESGGECTGYCTEAAEEDEDEILFTNYRRFLPRNRQNQYPRNFNSPRPQTSASSWRNQDTSRPQTPASNWRNQDRQKRGTTNRRIGRNPLDATGMPTRCVICQSINHWKDRCPDKNPEHSTLFTDNTIVLHQSNDGQSDLKSLVAETWSSALLDCGASKTVCGNEWFQQYQESLSDDNLRKIKTSESNNSFRFGDGKRITSQKSVTLPASIGSMEVTIKADVVDSDIPLLLSRDSMKKANMNLDFESDTITIFGEKIPLITTASGHYAIPITRPIHLVNELDTGKRSNITLAVSEEKSSHDVALKLHRQFAHASEQKLLGLINNAGHPWSNNEELKSEIKKVCDECKTCKVYRRPPPRPVVSLPTATRFKETVALDLKFYNGMILIHMIDHATRLSCSSVIPNKKPETIVKHMLSNFIQVYGQAESFLSDNGGEFINQTFLELCDLFGIRIKTTAAESPWSNGLVERHNLVLAEMLDKITDDTNCSMDIAVAWAINAKNSLNNVHGFSPFQLALGCNPTLPNVLNDQLPALSNRPTSSIIKQNLDALHKAREAFTQAENSEKIKRALTHNVRTSGDIRYFNGDTVYYKRKDSREWHGPAVVLGQDGQQVLVKHGEVYMRVHPCRLNPIKKAASGDHTHTDSNQHLNSQKPLDIPDENRCKQDDDDTDSEDESDSLQTLNTPSATCPTDKRAEVPSQANQNEHLPRDRTMSDLCHRFENSFHENDGSDHEPSPDILEHVKPNQTIRYKSCNDGSWVQAKVVSRAGKATRNSRYSNWWNIEVDNEKFSADLSTVQDLSILPPETSELTLISSPEEMEAKNRELAEWKNRAVYTEVKAEDQNVISLRWVIKKKNSDGKPFLKARLCARGFQEEQNFRTDSPTCSREGIRITLSLIASNSWKLNSIDVKTAFLQGKSLQRDVFVKPPKEANTTHIWKLNKCVYGLADASRYWYLKLREELLKLGAKPCSLDQGIFVWYKDGKIRGIVACFVDDVLWGGDDSFYEVIRKLRSAFHIGSENESSFDYIGVKLKQQSDFSIIANQEEFIDNIEYIPVSPAQKARRDEPLSDQERKLLRGALGKLNWLAGMTRPEISFYTCELSTHINTATISDLITINKVIKFVKNRPGFIKFSRLNTDNLTIKVFADASWNSLPDGGSQGGQIVFGGDNRGWGSPIIWGSTRIKRVARSSMSAESLSVLDGCDSAHFINKLLEEILNLKKKIPVIAITDSDDLFTTSSTTRLVTDRRLRVEISAIRQMIEREEIELVWVDRTKQIADVLTKKGAPSQNLIRTIQTGVIHPVTSMNEGLLRECGVTHTSY